MKFDKAGFKEDLENLLELYFPNVSEQTISKIVNKIVFFVCKHLRLTSPTLGVVLDAEPEEEEDDA